jgi:hypothetical protein
LCRLYTAEVTYDCAKLNTLLIVNATLIAIKSDAFDTSLQAASLSVGMPAFPLECNQNPNIWLESDTNFIFPAALALLSFGAFLTQQLSANSIQNFTNSCKPLAESHRRDSKFATSHKLMSLTVALALGVLLIWSAIAGFLSKSLRLRKGLLSGATLVSAAIANRLHACEPLPYVPACASTGSSPVLV